MCRELVFYDYEFRPLGRVARAADIYHKELYNGIGSFEAEIDRTEPMAAELLNRNYTVVIWDGLQAVITSAQAAAGEGTVRIYGRTPNWLLAKRACPNFGHRKGTPYELAHSLVEEVWGDSIAVGPGRSLKAEETTFWRNVYNPLSEVVADCLDRAEGGHRVVYDIKGKQWRFETYEGRPLPLVFSADRRNAADISYSRSVLDYFNGGFYTTDENSGVWNEISSDREGIYRWTARLASTGESSAKNELDKKKIESGIDFNAQGLRRGKDYELGDLVKAVHAPGGRRVVCEMRITAVERWASYNDSGERPLLEERGSEKMEANQ